MMVMAWRHRQLNEPCMRRLATDDAVATRDAGSQVYDGLMQTTGPTGGGGCWRVYWCHIAESTVGYACPSGASRRGTNDIKRLTDVIVLNCRSSLKYLNSRAVEVLLPPYNFSHNPYDDQTDYMRVGQQLDPISHRCWLSANQPLHRIYRHSISRQVRLLCTIHKTYILCPQKVSLRLWL